MLKVLGVLPVKRTTFEVDEYIPLKFRCLYCHDISPLYWRTGDFHKQLLELGINPQSGAICKITVTGIDGPIEGTDEEHQAISGIPICDTSVWSNRSGSDREVRFEDEPRSFQVYVGQSQIRLDLFPETVVTTWFTAGKAEFGIDDRDALVAINFAQLTSEEMKTIGLSLYPNPVG